MEEEEEEEEEEKEEEEEEEEDEDRHCTSIYKEFSSPAIHKDLLLCLGRWRSSSYEQ